MPFVSFPKTAPPPDFVFAVMDAFAAHSSDISTVELESGLKSDEVLGVLRPRLEGLGFQVERGKRPDQVIDRPVFFGENGSPTHRYPIDAYHPQWRCGLEVEAGRAWMGNAVYRDLVLAMVMVDVDHLMLAVPTCYRYSSSGRPTQHDAYSATVSVAETLYAHARVHLPYGLTVIGY